MIARRFKINALPAFRRAAVRIAIRFGVCGMIAAAAALAAGAANAHATENVSAVALLYHRFGDGRYPTTNITMDQLDAQIAELTNGDYNVVPLDTIIDAMEKGTPLPPRTVAITIDDAYRSVYANGWPKLRAAGLPITLFVSTDPIDRGLEDMMTWDQIREMQAAGVEIGAHTASHLHMPMASPESMRREIDKSNARFKAELGKVPALFAYPYGEASIEAETIVKKAGYRAAFGQHSGAMSGTDDRFYLPRFSLNEKYGGIDRLKTAASAMALNVTDMTPSDMMIRPDKGDPNPPAVGFTVTTPGVNLDHLTCFFSHDGAAKVERLGSERIEVRTNQPMPVGRTRLNCTLPGHGKNSGRWYWYGRQFYIPPQ